MTRIRSWLMVIIPAVLAVLGGGAISAQDKYTVQVPNGLAFSEFKGYEAWQVISLSHSEELMAVIVGNPAMIDAYKAGIPGNGKPFPDGAKMAKIHWNPIKSEDAPAPTTVPGTLHDVDFMVKDSKRFSDSGGWGYGMFKYDAASDTFTPGTIDTSRRRRTTPSAGSRAIRSCRQKTTFSRRTRRDERRTGLSSLPSALTISQASNSSLRWRPPAWDRCPQGSSSLPFFLPP